MAKFCGKCGAPLESGDRFCMRCGEPVMTGDGELRVPKQSSGEKESEQAASFDANLPKKKTDLATRNVYGAQSGQEKGSEGYYGANSNAGASGDDALQKESKETTSSPQKQSQPSAKHSPKRDAGKHNSKKIIIIIACVALGLIVAGALIFGFASGISSPSNLEWTFVYQNEKAVLNTGATVNGLIDRLSGNPSLYINDNSQIKAILRSSRPAPSGVQTENLSITKPNGTPLINNLSLFLKPGDRLLIKGVSGIGKSTLLKTIAGIWPYCNGQIKFPKEKKVMFLSQKPYMPIGTLAQVICYPSSVANDNSSLEKMLERVGLEYLAPNLNIEDQWSMILSLGEQQRIALLRVIVNKPDVVFMDEVTSAIDESNEFYLYEMLKKELPESIIISIGHRTTLEKQHTKILDCSTDVKKIKTLD